ncbi:MAG: DUF5110 domain-containing protein [Treponemataceae bacterium]|nr:DUF5110 domain-containing protein [Treponemataceae bacterium]
MKRRICCLTFVLSFLLSAEAATKLKFASGISLVFEGCEDGSVRFEARGKKASAPVQELELKRPAARQDFVKNPDGTYSWRNYTVAVTEDGYALSYGGEPMYTAKFSEEKTLLREIRTWDTAEEFYGFGEASRSVSLRNQSFTIYNVSRHGDHAFLFIPFYVTDTAASVYYNANGRDKIYFQDGADAQVYRSEYKRIESFVRQDASPQEGVARFYEETGVSCLLPRWAFGYIQSKYGYKSQQEVVDLVDEFRRRNIPLSAVVLDLYWFEKMGDIFWTSPEFPEPKELDRYLEENGVKLVTITEPFFSVSSQNFDELKKSGLLCAGKSGAPELWRDWWCLGDKEGGLLNPLAKKAPAFLGKKYAAMLDSGIDGFWTDLGEPEGAPAAVRYGKYAEQDFHNYYNYYWSKAIYEGVKQHNPDRRLFLMSRSGYTGIGKFNVSVWSGDVAVSWTALANQLAFGINAGLSGLPYWGSDVGGFTQAETYPELFVRWQQFGAFTPVYRAHGTGGREPWIFTDKETAIVSKYIDTRMALLPYIYSTARQTMGGVPMMRPMFYADGAEDIPQEFIASQYLFGDSLLVAPVVREISVEGEKSVWLPAGGWYDFETLRRIDAGSGRAVSVTSELETIPVYIREGAIIPAAYGGADCLFLAPAEGASNSFVFYNDDGETERYKDGAFAEIEFALDGMTLSATARGAAEFLPEAFTLAVPAGTAVSSSGWKRSGKFLTKTVSVESLAGGMKL